MYQGYLRKILNKLKQLSKRKVCKLQILNWIVSLFLTGFKNILSKEYTQYRISNSILTVQNCFIFQQRNKMFQSNCLIK